MDNALNLAMKEVTAKLLLIRIKNFSSIPEPDPIIESCVIPEESSG